MAIRDLTQENLQKDVLENAQPVVIKAYATWCGPCMYMAPVFQEIAKEYQEKAVFFELNVDHARDLAIHFGISSIPTLIFVKNGQVVSKETGYMDREDLSAKIKQFLGTAQAK